MFMSVVYTFRSELLNIKFDFMKFKTSALKGRVPDQVMESVPIRTSSLPLA